MPLRIQSKNNFCLRAFEEELVCKGYKTFAIIYKKYSSKCCNLQFKKRNIAMLIRFEGNFVQNINRSNK